MNASPEHPSDHHDEPPSALREVGRTYSLAIVTGLVALTLLALSYLLARPIPADIYPTFALDPRDDLFDIGLFVSVEMGWFAALGAVAITAVFELARRGHTKSAVLAASTLQTLLWLPACAGDGAFLQQWRGPLVAAIGAGSLLGFTALVRGARAISEDRRTPAALVWLSMVLTGGYLLQIAVGRFAGLYPSLFVWAALWVQAAIFLLVASAIGRPRRLWIAALPVVALGLLDPLGVLDDRSIQLERVYAWRCPEAHTAIELRRSATLSWFKVRRLLEMTTTSTDTERRAPPPETRPERRLHVVYFIVDALRRDRIGYFGYPDASTPHLDRLAERSIVYRRAYSPSPTTGYSIVSMITGLLPNTLLETSTVPLLLPDVLVTHGYRSGASAPFAGLESNYPVLAGLGSEGIGFTTVSDIERRMLSADYDREIVDAMASRLVRSDEPRFEYVHLLSTHGPFMGASAEVDYQEAVREVDAILGDFLARLEESGLREQTVLIVTGDHGESLGEYGRFAHSSSLYREQISVPLLVSIPGEPHREIDHPVTLTVLPHIAMRALGARWPVEETPSIEGMRLNRDFAVQEYHVGSNLMWRSIQYPPWVLHHRVVTDRYELYRPDGPSDIERDNLTASSPDTLEELRSLERAVEAFEERRASEPARTNRN